MTTVVYLYEQQLKELLQKKSDHQTFTGIAYAWDDHTVFHAYTKHSAVHPAGELADCDFIQSSSNFGEIKNYIAKLSLQKLESRPKLIVFFAEEKNSIEVKAFVKRSEERRVGKECRYR